MSEELDYFEKQFLEKHPFNILTQRLKKSLNLNVNLDKSDDTIVIEHKKSINKDMIDRINSATNYHTIIEESKKEEDSEISQMEKQNSIYTDSGFREKCNKARLICRKYVYIFFVFEKISSILMCFCPIFQIICETQSVTRLNIILFAAFFLVVTIMNSIGDWSRLREKYSRLHHKFGILSNSKDDDKVSKYKRYIVGFGSDDLFIDTFVFNNEINELE